MSNGGVLNTSGSNPVGTSRYPITPFVVGPSSQAGYQTIQSAIDAANAAGGGMVWVQPGTYTENLTFYSGIQISTPSEQTVTIIGTHVPPASGTLNIDRLTFQSATDIFSSSAAGTASIIIEDCTVRVTNGYTFNLPNWGPTGSIAAFNIGPSGTNDGFINNTSGTSISIFSAGVGNGSTNSMIVSGATFFGPGITINCPVSASSGASILSTNNQYFGTFTFSGNSYGNFYNDSFVTSTSSSIIYNSSGSSSLNNCSINNSSVAAIDGSGAGPLLQNGVSFLNSSSLAATLNITYGNVLSGGELRAGSDIGGRINTTAITRTNSTTIGAGTGTVKMSSANSANSAAWIKIYVGTTAYWIPAWTTNSP